MGPPARSDAMGIYAENGDPRLDANPSRLISVAVGLRRSEAAAGALGRVGRRDGRWRSVDGDGRRRRRRIPRAYARTPPSLSASSGTHPRISFAERVAHPPAGGRGGRTTGAARVAGFRLREGPAVLLGCALLRPEASALAMGRSAQIRPRIAQPLSLRRHDAEARTHPSDRECSLELIASRSPW